MLNFHLKLFCLDFQGNRFKFNKLLIDLVLNVFASISAEVYGKLAEVSFGKVPTSVLCLYVKHEIIFD